MRRTLSTLIALAALSSPAAESPFEDVWSETGFDRVAVQFHGLNRTMVTFARDALREVTTHALIKGEDEITLVLTLIAQPGLLADRRLIPIEGDDLIPVLEQAGIAVEDRALRLSDCLGFDGRGQIRGQGPALFAASTAYATAPSGTPLHTAIDRLAGRLQALSMLSRDFKLVPHPVDPNGLWTTLDEAPPGQRAALLPHQGALLDAVAAGDPEAARLAAAPLAAGLRALPNYPSGTRLSIDHAYTTLRPYFWASLAYVLCAVLFFVSLVTKRDLWWWMAIGVMGAGWTVHMLGAAARGYLLQRMPLSNLYEATTTGLAFAIGVALVLELIYRMRVVGLCSAALAFLYYRWLKSSDIYGNDAIEPLRAVLNSYWLDYHVTCMIISYAAFTVAFGMAVLYLLKTHAPRLMGWAPPPEELDLYNHRAIQAGWPILGIGVVLGAIWADTAWGRMWSWDPKETWALITWLIYTAYMHVRLVHGWSGRATAWTSIAGYGCVLFTYLGVNFVLSGLHSYAGNDPVALTGVKSLFATHWPLWLAAGLPLAGVILWRTLRRERRPLSAEAVNPDAAELT